jgi:predicted Rossmann fold nucleotide-binding protein DprA/Smf involved in DNA uptake
MVRYFKSQFFEVRELGRNTIDIIRLLPEKDDCPENIKRYVEDYNPEVITAKGDLEILQRKKLAIFCSVKCPGALILQTYDLMRALREAGVVVVSGFHSPVEQECLQILLSGAWPLVVCPARSIEEMRLTPAYKKLLSEGRLLLLSPFSEKYRRITAQNSLLRNRFVCAIADEIFIPYAAPGSKTEQFCIEILSGNQLLFMLDSDYNTGLIARGAIPVRPDSIPEGWIQG